MPHSSLSNIKPENYAQWLKKPTTERLLAIEASWLRAWVQQLYGFQLAYTGIDHDPKFLNHSRTQHCFKLGFDWGGGEISRDAVIEEDAWPIADESLDVVILQHSLDFSRQPHHLLREACRTVVPSGYVLIVGFNPISLWGGWRWLRTFSAQLPWITRPLASSRLIDWLTLLDLKVEQVFHCAHLWPLTLGTDSLSRRVDRVMAGTSWLPANAYLIVARKTVTGITPIRLKKRMRYNFSFGLPVTAAVQRPIELDLN